ncbi:MAG: prolyl oligopeptidase family serine peptidase [Gemmatimonadetes bacterium]|nr:prolyl oligopeptidase family serine peptidase [Gemmatimonadota bacterium]
MNLGPRFDARAALWVERGGIYVQATLRGGNEFGEAWHRGDARQQAERLRRLHVGGAVPGRQRLHRT